MKWLILLSLLTRAALAQEAQPPPPNPIVPGAPTLGNTCVPPSPGYFDFAHGVLTSCQLSSGNWTWTALGTDSGGGGWPTGTTFQSFGAVGNGIVDDTAALQAGINYSQTNGTCIFGIPGATYKITAALVISSSACIDLGTPYTEINQTASADVFQITAGAASLVILRNMTLNGGTNSIDFTATAYLFQSSDFYNLTMTGYSNAGFNVASGALLTSIDFKGPFYLIGGAYGLLATGGSNYLGATIWEGFHAYGNSSAAVSIINTDAGSLLGPITFTSPVIESNPGAGFHLDGAQVVAISPYFEQNGSAAGAADVFCDKTGASSTYFSAYGGIFSNASTAQSGVRVFYNAAGCHVSLERVYAGSTSYFNGNGETGLGAVFNQWDQPGFGLGIQNWIGHTLAIGAGALLATGIVDGSAPVTVTTTAAITIVPEPVGYNSGYYVNQEATAGTAITYTLPTAAAGLQYCFVNGYNGSAPDTGTLELLTSAAGQYIIYTDGTLSASGGYVISGGAARDSACAVGVDATHWLLYVSWGTWSKY